MTIDWATTAILGTIALAVVHVVDSHLIARRMPSLQAYLLPVGFIISTFGIVTCVLYPLPADVAAGPLWVAVACGVLRTLALSILLYILKTQEVSWASPLFHTYPVFVALMAVPLLGEVLGWLQWLAVFIVVLGALVISIKRSPAGHRFRPDKPFFMLALASLLMAMSDVCGKYALDYISYWNVYWISSFSMVAGFLLVSLRPAVFRQLGKVRRLKTTLAVMAANETLAMGGIVLIFWAMAAGPVSLVSTISSSRPIFVFIIALVISFIRPDLLLEEKSAKGVLALRLLATAMIAAGIAIIYLV
jgi:drug/metabolite transporter (DMT)-like permease